MHKSEVVVKSEPAMIIAQSNKVMQSLVNELYNDSIQEGETDSSFIEQVPQDEQESDAHANQENNYQIKGKSAAKKPALPLSAPSSLAPSLPASPLSVPPVPAMKQKRIPWSDRETEVFIAAVKEFGYSWKDIKFKYGQSDGPLALRSNVQLKDKARNIRAYRLRNKIDLGDFAE
ncbi:hypothetical protein BDF19DRAFT_78838 [Syncephalis fuscata]|nr:hypothetical protein BDF19DRAFT_78838 [Syncephalis fuscata]